jgi:hypothetical protein
MAKTNTKKKAMTLEGFAAAIHKDYLSISKKMATKDDIRQVRKDMATKSDLYNLGQKMVTVETFRDLQNSIQMITTSMVSKADLATTLGEELRKSEHGKRMEDFQTRLGVVEQKLGIKPTHHAASKTHPQ